jgi:hypothetical protein
MKKITNLSKSLLVILVLFLVCIFNMYPSCNVSTASLSDVKVCGAIGSDGDCTSGVSSMPASAPVIYCSAQLKNAPSGTKVTFTWKRAGESIASADVETSSAVVYSNLTTNGALTPGKYSVTVKINTDNAEPVTKEFTVE